MSETRVKFSRTQEAAKSDRLSKWQLIEAIAEDAVENGLTISGTESVLAAKAALEAAGEEYADGTVKELCVVAKFDWQSTKTQRRIWRRYGWTAIRTVVKAGETPESAAVLLGAERLTRLEILAQVQSARVPGHPEKPLDDAWSEWLNQGMTWLLKGAKLVARTEDTEGVELGAHAAIGRMLYERISEKAIDAELRHFFDTEGVS